MRGRRIASEREDDDDQGAHTLFSLLLQSIKQDLESCATANSLLAPKPNEHAHTANRRRQKTRSVARRGKAARRLVPVGRPDRMCFGY